MSRCASRVIPPPTLDMKLTPDISLLVIVGIFWMTYFVVRRFFFEPVNRVMVERQTEHRLAQQRYEESLARFQEATSVVEGQLHEAKREASHLRDQFRAEAANHRNAVVQKTQKQAEQIVTEADAKLKQDVVKARDTIVRDADSLARLAAERILGRAI
jgi:F-type H+-transporting ATPase subunit b